MAVHQAILKIQSRDGNSSFSDITELVKQEVRDSNVSEGICAVISPHTTCSVYFDEWTHDINDYGADYLQQDLDRILTQLVPRQTDFPPAAGYHYPGPKHFENVEAWPNADEYLPGGDRRQLLNADAHLKATLLGSSQVFSVENGKLGFGVTGYIFFVDFDQGRSRQRSCRVVVAGD